MPIKLVVSDRDGVMVAMAKEPISGTIAAAHGVRDEGMPWALGLGGPPGKSPQTRRPQRRGRLPRLVLLRTPC